MAATSGRMTAAGGPQGTRALPSRSTPPVELPSAVPELAVGAARELGWHGIVLPQGTILGRRVCVVARMRTEAHAERIAMGIPPVTDRTRVGTWTWPEMAGSAPAAAAEIVGVLSVARHWRTGLASVVPFARYHDAAVVVPSCVAMTNDYVDNCLPRARAFGVAVATADAESQVALDVPGRSERLTLGEDAVSRWVNEVVYSQLLDAAELPAAVE